MKKIIPNVILVLAFLAVFIGFGWLFYLLYLYGFEGKTEVSFLEPTICLLSGIFAIALATKLKAFFNMH